MDSVIVWGQEISPILEKENQMELSFSIRQLVVYIYSLRGDIGKAIDEARLMYEKAEAMKYDLGIALSSAAIGDAYFCSNMPEEAIDSYKKKPSVTPPRLRKTIIIRRNDHPEILYRFSSKEHNSGRSGKYRKMLSESKSIHTHKTLFAIPDTCHRCHLLYRKE